MVRAARTVGQAVRHRSRAIRSGSFVGPGVGQFKRTYNRHDFSQPPPKGTGARRAGDRGVKTIGVGKNPRYLRSPTASPSRSNTEGNDDGLRRPPRSSRR